MLEAQKRCAPPFRVFYPRIVLFRSPVLQFFEWVQLVAFLVLLLSRRNKKRADGSGSGGGGGDDTFFSTFLIAPKHSLPHSMYLPSLHPTTLYSHDNRTIELRLFQPRILTHRDFPSKRSKEKQKKEEKLCFNAQL